MNNTMKTILIAVFCVGVLGLSAYGLNQFNTRYQWCQSNYSLYYGLINKDGTVNFTGVINAIGYNASELIADCTTGGSYHQTLNQGEIKLIPQLTLVLYAMMPVTLIGALAQILWDNYGSVKQKRGAGPESPGGGVSPAKEEAKEPAEEGKEAGS